MKDRFWGTLLGVFLTLTLFFSGLFSWLTPLPLFYIARRHSVRFGVAGWGLIALTLWGVYQLLFRYFIPASPAPAAEPSLLTWFSWLPGMAYYELFGKQAVFGAVMVYGGFFAGLSLTLALRSSREKDVMRLMAWVLGMALLSAFVILLAFTRGDLDGFLQGAIRYLNDVLEQFIALNKSAGVEGEELAFIEVNRGLLVGSFIRAFPGLILAGALFLTWFNVVVAKRIFYPLGFFPRLQDLSRFRLPFFAVWGVIGALVLFFANLYLWKNEVLNSVLMNGFIVLIVIYFFQGLAIMSFYLTLKGVTPWMRFLLYFLIVIFVQPLGLFLVGVGFFDSWVNFRKLNLHPTV